MLDEGRLLRPRVTINVFFLTRIPLSCLRSFYGDTDDEAQKSFVVLWSFLSGDFCTKLPWPFFGRIGQKRRSRLARIEF